MAVTPLVRAAVEPLYRDARDAHPGLLLQRGYPEHDPDKADGKTAHIRRVCAIGASDFYRRAYARWVRATADDTRFAGTALELETRLFIGLSGSGMLETGCAIHHSYGVPYIPGSSVKGVVNAFVRKTGLERSLCDEVFGAPADPKSDHRDGLAGLIAFHDTWWVPGSAATPLVEEVVTTHHLEYYGTEGAVEATDLDSPVPNAQVAVRGSFLFTLEGPAEWLKLAVEMLEKALISRGIGAKTRAGYGLMRADELTTKHWQQTRADERARQQAVRDQRQHEAEMAARQAEYDALSNERKLLRDTELAFDRYRQSSSAQHNQREAMVGTANRLLEGAQAWASERDRVSAAELLTRIFDTMGWADPGKSRDQREKQERKRHTRVDALRRSEEGA
jgi:CRISPR-associated protein Cmr6